MNNPDPTDPRAQARRLLDALADELPGEDEARETVARLGVDVQALAARIRARVGAGAARVRLDSIRPALAPTPEDDERWVVEMLAAQRRGRAREGRATWAAAGVLAGR